MAKPQIHIREDFIEHIHSLVHAQVTPLLHWASDIRPGKISVSKKCVTERGGVKAEVISKSFNRQLKESFFSAESYWVTHTRCSDKRLGVGIKLSSEWAPVNCCHILHNTVTFWHINIRFCPLTWTLSLAKALSSSILIWERENHFIALEIVLFKI